ncbi:unnamed protein product [Angiostrongylus costaricensis]|uniref:NAD_binding_4 domain-containing protein n=1 Tax=Angiostrongylus costaricensis TaxID=334426 RepID=A0A0R3PZB1_ANGCS|nr:unnamed protein product [Angiostrongylus costaricensis]
MVLILCGFTSHCSPCRPGSGCDQLGVVRGRVEPADVVLAGGHLQTHLTLHRPSPRRRRRAAAHQASQHQAVRSHQQRKGHRSHTYAVLTVQIIPSLSNMTKFFQARPVRPPPNMPDHDYKWIQFYGLLAPTLTTLHNLYSQLDTPVQSLDTAIATFSETELRPCVESFRELYRSYSLGIFASLRRAQLDRMANFSEIPDEKLLVVTAYYTSMLYTLGVLASRLQSKSSARRVTLVRNNFNDAEIFAKLRTGFRFEWQCKFPYSMSDPVRNLLDIVYLAVDQLVADCLFAAEPATNAILVTNNLFPFNCDSLAHAVVFKQFDVQIVSEETAQAIQVSCTTSIQDTYSSSTLA